MQDLEHTKLKHECKLYKIKDKNNKVIYIGKDKSISQARVQDHYCKAKQISNQF